MTFCGMGMGIVETICCCMGALVMPICRFLT